MAYAERRFKPEIMIDVATLTGACVIALGEKIAGVFSKDEACSRASWRRGAAPTSAAALPLPEDYKELLKSSYADISNMPAALRQRARGRPVSRGVRRRDPLGAHRHRRPGPAPERGRLLRPRGTGFGVRLLMDWLMNNT